MNFELSIPVIIGIINLLVLAFAMARGVVTKGDCKECKTGINTELEKGNNKFDTINETLAGQKVQLIMIVDSVAMLVNHHVDKD